MYKTGKIYYKILARARGQVGRLTRYLIWKEIGPKVNDDEKPGWRDNQGQDKQVPLYMNYIFIRTHPVRTFTIILLHYNVSYSLFIKNNYVLILYKS